MTELLPENTVPEFYYFKRFRYDWHLVFYCHDEEAFFTSQSEAAFNRREGQARDFMNRLQRLLRLRQKEMLFFASTEFGTTGRAHLHVLISFDGLRRKGRKDKVDTSSALMEQAIEEIRMEMGLEHFKIGCEAVGHSPCDQHRTLSYVCKKEFGFDYKHCFCSSWLLTKAEATTETKKALLPRPHGSLVYT